MAIQLFCATANQAKLREFRLAAGEGIEISGLPPCDCPEDGVTFEENAISKALCYSGAAAALMAGAAKAPLVFADDSGIAVDSLNGAPGIYSARFAGPNAGDEANNALLLEKLAGVPEHQRTARFVCSIALVRGGELIQTFSGQAEGYILEQPVGSGGFGYDPLFFFPALGRAFAELTPEEKWKYSHRGQAFRKLLAWLRESGDR
jgi:XTP/dITP diphosphohydrolase